MLIRLLDVSGEFHPIWRYHEAKGSPPGAAADECVRLLRQAASAADADYVVACCDSPTCFRSEIAKEYRALLPTYTGYKGDRAAKEPALLAALDRVISEIEQDGVPIMRADGFEADDVIATIAAWATAQGHDVEAHSEDKDLLSLVMDPDPESESAPSVVVVRRDGTRQNSDACIARLGVPPSLVPEFLALHGDKSDGVLGVPDVGKVWAVRLLWGEYDAQKQWRPTPFRNFDAIVAAAVEEQAEVERAEQEKLCKRVHTGAKRGVSDEQIAAKLNITIDDVARFKAMAEPPKMPEVKTYFAENVRKGLISHAASFDIGLRLTRLRTDVPLDFSQVTAPRVPKPLTERTTFDPATVAAFEEPKDMTTNGHQQTPDAEFTAPSDKTPAAQPAPTSATSPHAPAAIVAEVSGKPAQETSLAVVQTQAMAAQGQGREFERQLEPFNFMQAVKLAEAIAKSRKLKNMNDANEVLTQLALGRSIGLNLFQSLCQFYIVEGRGTMAAQLVIARVRQHPQCEFFRKVRGDANGAAWETKRRGDPRTMTWTFTIEDAKRAKLGGFDKKDNRGAFDPDSNWAKYPAQMCSWRAALFLAREEWTEITAGIYDPDEIREQRSAPADEAA